ncbi:cyclic nucleotide-binding domain-containing protein, partial [Candidatus Parcubacteria bacterium]|nr:cyclic nucleotide-binding domain-containing protein [Candidatus Parcubacteria bacterium]
MNKAILSQISLFKNLSPKEISIVADFLIDKQYNQGDKIFKVGTVRDKIIIITDGMAALKTGLDSEQTIALFKKYDSLGEMALVSKASTHQYGLE